jgi:N-acyl-L-homoserine lactone synthetase
MHAYHLERQQFISEGVWEERSNVFAERLKWQMVCGQGNSIRSSSSFEEVLTPFFLPSFGKP